MTQRFVKNQVRSPLWNALFSVLIFTAVFLCFYIAINLVSDKTAAQEKSTLETAVQRQIAHCYAMEGYYPESLDYLASNYGLVYDKERFFIDYQVQGSNIMPDVTIIDKEGKQ